jgi:hypothetical protein
MTRIALVIIFILLLWNVGCTPTPCKKGDTDVWHRDRTNCFTGQTDTEVYKRKCIDGHMLPMERIR